MPARKQSTSGKRMSTRIFPPPTALGDRAGAGKYYRLEHHGTKGLDPPLPRLLSGRALHASGLRASTLSGAFRAGSCDLRSTATVATAAGGLRGDATGSAWRTLRRREGRTTSGATSARRSRARAVEKTDRPTFCRSRVTPDERDPVAWLLTANAPEVRAPFFPFAIIRFPLGKDRMIRPEN